VTAPLVLPARLGFAAAEALLGAGPEAPAPDQPLDASGVREMSGAAVTALVVIARGRAAAGGRLAILRPSPAFVDAFADLGLFPELMKMEVRR
jgi:hypothetical protein